MTLRNIINKLKKYGAPEAQDFNLVVYNEKGDNWIEIADIDFSFDPDELMLIRKDHLEEFDNQIKNSIDNPPTPAILDAGGTR